MNDNNGATGWTGTRLYPSLGIPAGALADAARSAQDPAIDHELDELDAKLTCALGGLATDEDKAKIERSAELQKVITHVRELHRAVPFTSVARTRVDLANEGAFGPATRSTWNARTQVERTLATQHVYEVMFAALAAGFRIVPPEHARVEQPSNPVAAVRQAPRVPGEEATP